MPSKPNKKSKKSTSHQHRHQTTLSSTEIASISETHNATSYLSSSVNTDQFLKSRQKEIILLEKSMKAKPSVYNKHGMRLFQILPRYMRRRQMSHNIHLMPAYLRRKAAFEYSSSVFKRKKRKLRRWRKNKMVQQVNSVQRDPVDLCFVGNSVESRNLLREMRNIRTNDLDLDTVHKWETLQQQQQQEPAHHESADQKNAEDTVMQPAEDASADLSIISSINDSLAHIPLPADEEEKDKTSGKSKKRTSPLFGPKRSINHLFLAKRSHVRPMWGNLVCWSSNDKIFRVTNRFYKTHCTVSDDSHLVTLQLSGALNDIISVINAFAQTKISSDSSSLEAELDGKKRFIFEAYDSKLDTPYGSVDVLFASEDTSASAAVHHLEQEAAQNSNEDAMEDEEDTPNVAEADMQDDQSDSADNNGSRFRTCLLWLHPSTLPHSYYRFGEECQKRNVTLEQRVDLCRISMRGPHVSTVLCRNNILSLPVSHNHPDKIQFWKQLKASKDIVTPDGTAVSLKVRHPQYPESQLSHDDLSRLLQSGGSESSGGSFTQNDLTSFSRGSLVSGTDNLWKKNFYLKFDPKHDDATYENKTIQRPQRQRVRKLKGKTVANSAESNVAESQWFTTLFDITLLKHETGDLQFGSGWDIICPREMTASFFYKLGHTHHVLLVPLVDQLRMRTEQSKLNFPFDYPDAFSFYTLKEDDFAAMMYKKRCITDSWQSIYDACGARKGEQLRFLRPDVPRDAPLASNKQDECVFSSVQLDFSFGEIPIRKGRLLMARDEATLKDILLDPHRAIAYSSDLQCVGFVTTGIHSLERGQGYAHGYVREQIVSNLKQKDQFTVLLYWDPENNKEHVFTVKCYKRG